MVDQQLLLFLNGLPGHVPGLGALAVVFAQDVIYLYAVLVLWLWGWRGGAPLGGLVRRKSHDERRRLLLLAVGAAALALIVNVAVSRVVARPRPFMTHDLHVLIPSPARATSFPSDHTAASSAVAVALFLGGEAGWGAVAFLGAVLIGTARIVAGVHYPSDILGGLIVGVICGAAMIRGRAAVERVLDLALRAARRLHLT